MQRQINVYTNVMINEILQSESQDTVFGIIDKQVRFISTNEALKDLKDQFLQNAIDSLNKLDFARLQAIQNANISMALEYLETLKQDARAIYSKNKF
jgi:hypothetical protein